MTNRFVKILRSYISQLMVLHTLTLKEAELNGHHNNGSAFTHTVTQVLLLAQLTAKQNLLSLSLLWHISRSLTDLQLVSHKAFLIWSGIHTAALITWERDIS